MQQIAVKLTVFFDDPFWVGLYERECGGQLEVCKITFGAEPKDYQVYDFLLHNWKQLVFSPAIVAGSRAEVKINPKRMQRAISKQLVNPATGTKAQQALQLQREEGKLARQQRSRQQKQAEQKQQFELKQRKRKEKRRGR